MIRLKDALTLSFTKLKTRRIRLAVMIIVSGLFFVLLVFASLVFNGAADSIKTFSQDGLGGRYIVRVESVEDAEFTMYQDKQLIEKAKAADKQYIAAKQAEAKRLGIEYDPTSESPSVFDDGSGTGLRVQETPQSKSLLDAYREDFAKPFFAALDTAQEAYGATGRFIGTTLFAGGGGSELPALIPIKDNKEIAVSEESQNTAGFTTISSGLTALDDAVLESFLIEGQNLNTDKSGAIPVVAPYTAVEEAVGLVPLGANAPSSQRLERLKEVRAKAAGTKFQVCIRNGTSQERQLMTADLLNEIQKNKANPEYVQPELVYALAGKPCQDVVVTKDVRSAETKAFDAKQLAFEEKFAKDKPEQRIVTFRIVGVAPDMNVYQDGFEVSSILSGLVASNLGNGWFVPSSAQTALPEYDSVWEKAGKTASYEDQILLEFASAEEAKKFVDEKTCEPSFTSLDDPFAICRKEGKPFLITSYGSNSVALEQARTWFESAFVQAALFIALLSAITMMGTVGKVIADSRRETAVFRAIGAKRSDIAIVYVLYTLLLGIIIASFALILGFTLAYVLNDRYTAELSVEALTIFNSQDLNRQFILIGVNTGQLLQLVAIILGAALLSAILPLINNLKRNPIKDMRDER